MSLVWAAYSSGDHVLGFGRRRSSSSGTSLKRSFHRRPRDRRAATREFIAAAWFGPKGFASVAYGLLIVASGIDHRSRLFHLVGLVVAGSIVAHSSTDVIVARWFREVDEEAR